FTYLVDGIRLDRPSSSSGLRDPGSSSGLRDPGSSSGLRDPGSSSGVRADPREADSRAHVIPYSLVTAIDLHEIAPEFKVEAGDSPPLLLNEWAARNLGARPGDTVTLDYRAWEDPGLLKARSATFHLAGVVPVKGA